MARRSGPTLELTQEQKTELVQFLMEEISLMLDGKIDPLADRIDEMSTKVGKLDVQSMENSRLSKSNRDMLEGIAASQTQLRMQQEDENKSVEALRAKVEPIISLFTNVKGAQVVLKAVIGVVTAVFTFLGGLYAILQLPWWGGK